MITLIFKHLSLPFIDNLINKTQKSVNFLEKEITFDVPFKKACNS